MSQYDMGDAERDARGLAPLHAGSPPLKLSEQYHVGQEVKAWSERVFGIPVPFKITKVGTKLIHGDFTYAGHTWHASGIHPDRILP